MKRFIEGRDRSQQLLLPEQLDDYVTDSNPVWVGDVFVDELNLLQMGFASTPAATGRPGYHPSVLLKIYIYGYLNRLQSSRRLEREVQGNVELVWPTGHLKPDFKTNANFRKDNGAAMRVRRRTVEHPFGTIKSWMGATHFLTRTKAHVSTEMSLHVQAYKMKRMMNILGVALLLQALSA